MSTLSMSEFLKAISQTMQMVSISLLVGSLLGIPLGIVLVISRNGGIVKNKYVFIVLNNIINIIRSIPFIILLVSMIPITRFFVGTSIGTSAAIVPLIAYITPYIARLVENSLLEVNSGIIEAAEAMGATSLEIIWHFLLPEALGSLVLTLTTATIGLIGATAMAGAVGAGGLGDVAISYGYERFDTRASIITVVTLIIFVQAIQTLGNVLARNVRRK